MIKSYQTHFTSTPSLISLLELIKPVTWFPPMWAFLCGVVSVGALNSNNTILILSGLLLAGPLVCGMSQAVNDWCDRHVDAINQPERPIPSGRVSAGWGFFTGIIMSATSIIFAYYLGSLIFFATIIGVLAAWLYSLEPIRLKRSAIFGPGVVAICYEGLPWFTGAAIFTISLPNKEVLIVLSLYALGAHGIMTMNDFKATKGDKLLGINSLPVILGRKPATLVACLIMLFPQLIVISLFYFWGSLILAITLAVCVLLQSLSMIFLIRDPEKNTPFFNMTGVLLYIAGMMLSANGLYLMN
ncbi:chlorophyll synthase ChlG [Paracoccaceae bacterium]|nr:chlorophyll synthase ChlG [Paracoccaceae bacterium]